MKVYYRKHLVSVKVYNIKPSFTFGETYKPEKRFLGIRYQKEGFYGVFNSYTDMETYRWRWDTESTFLDNLVPMTKPRIVMEFSNKETLTWYFDTYEEAKEAAKKLIETNTEIIEG